MWSENDGDPVTAVVVSPCGRQVPGGYFGACQASALSSRLLSRTAPSTEKLPSLLVTPHPHRRKWWHRITRILYRRSAPRGGDRGSTVEMHWTWEGPGRGSKTASGVRGERRTYEGDWFHPHAQKEKHMYNTRREPPAEHGTQHTHGGRTHPGTSTVIPEDTVSNSFRSARSSRATSDSYRVSLRSVS